MARTVSRRRSAPVDVEQDDGDYTSDLPETRTRRSKGRSAGRTGSRSRARSEETEDRPGRTPTRRSRKSGSARRRGGRGWGAVSQARKEESNFPDRLKVGKEKIALKFLENEPFDTYWVHWIDRAPAGTKKSWVCIAIDADGNGCPLCEMGDTPAFRAAFNVVDLSSASEPQLLIWEATPDPRQQIEDAREDWGDLSEPDLYFRVSKKQQTNKRYTYKVERITEDDLDEKFGIESLSEDELAEFEDKLYTEDATESPSYEDLEEVAELLED